MPKRVPKKRMLSPTAGKMHRQPAPASKEVHFMRLLREAAKVHDLRERAKEMSPDGLRAYLLREFHDQPGIEEIRRMSAAEFASLQPLMVEFLGKQLRKYGDRMQ